MTRLLMLIFASFLAFSAPVAAKETGPSVVASIKPIHSLVSAVMKGVGTPHLIVKGFTSPHVYSLRPSDARALQDAQLIFWVGPNFENFMRAPIEALKGEFTSVPLSDVPGVKKRRLAERGTTHGHEHDEHAHDAHGHSDSPYDLHVWLDPNNAMAMVAAMQKALSTADPANAALYKTNGDQVIAQLEELTASVQADLAAVRDRPFVVFHDAYSYFEHRFDLHAAAAISVNPDTPPGAKRLKAIRRKIKELGVVCVFAEPQFSPKLVSLLTDGTGAKAGELDPLGARQPANADQYAALIRQLAGAIKTCLSR